MATVSEHSPVRREVNALTTELKSAALTVAGATAVVWAVFILDWILSGAISAWGVRPRTVAGLTGIAVMPFVHAGLGHLIGNTIAGIPLGFLAMERKKLDFFVVSGVSAITSGMGAWVFGAADSLHVGASGVIFGYLGFLMGRGVFERRAGPILLSLFVTLMYGGALVTMLPGLFAGISWQAHLFGWLGGLLVSRILAKRLSTKKTP